MISTTLFAIGKTVMFVLPWVLAVLLVSRTCPGLCDTSAPGTDSPSANKTVTLTVLFDNYPHDERLRTGWGFACLVTGLEKTILFDTGGDGTILLSNMRTLGAELGDVDIIVLSHEHYDHTGGLAAVLAENHNVTVFVPVAFSEGFKRQVRARGATLVTVDESSKICEGAHSTGQLGTGIKEQALCISTANGPFVITGCAHPGIVEMVKAAGSVSSSGVYGAMGGFHMKGFPENKIRAVIEQLKAMGIAVAGPSHCSGDLTREMMRRSFGEGYVTVGVGRTVELEVPPDMSTGQRILTNPPESDN
jgi:7,8-dihydropterin-6-yl-methyl-4-(beta-D-ribofuranosyl)aminobenzene 5'-phosphate synthase